MIAISCNEFFSSFCDVLVLTKAILLVKPIIPLAAAVQSLFVLDGSMQVAWDCKLIIN